MNQHRTKQSSAARRLCTAVAAAALTVTPVALALGSTPALVSVEIHDRTSGTILDVHPKDGQRYVVGTPGHEYAIRIRNRSRARILAVTSVDGVNVVTGESASPDQSGYVIDAGGSVDIEGWRTSLERTSAFYFTDLGHSYAARTGRPADVGVIGVAVFPERPTPFAGLARDQVSAADMPERAERASAAPQAAESGAATKQAGDAAAASGPIEQSSRSLVSRLGTGYGRTEASYAQRVQFERASDRPTETIALRYDRRENLIAMGVLAEPWYALRTPDPFPALRFVPPPR